MEEEYSAGLRTGPASPLSSDRILLRFLFPLTSTTPDWLGNSVGEEPFLCKVKRSNKCVHLVEEEHSAGFRTGPTSLSSLLLYQINVLRCLSPLNQLQTGGRLENRPLPYSVMFKQGERIKQVDR